MSLLTVESPVICSRVEFAFGADLTDAADSWTWTEMGDYTAEGRTRPRLVNQIIGVQNGRSNEANLADPSQIDVVLGNADGALTPRNPSSPYYPGITRGTPCRVLVQAGAPHLYFRGVSGSRARTPDAAALDITGDIAGIVEFLSPVNMPPQGTAYGVTGKYDVTGSQRSWNLFIFSGHIYFRWSVDGITTLDKLTALPMPWPEAGPVSVGWEFDVSNAGNNVMTWYQRRGTVDDLRANLTASQFGDPRSDVGATSLFSSSAPLDVGHVAGATTLFPYPGRINRVQIRSGNLTTGTVVADLDATQLSPGATGTTDTAGRVWTFTDAEVTDWRPRFCGRVESSKADWSIVDEDNPLAPTIAHVNVQASGILERLAQADALSSALTRFLQSQVNSSDLIACWPFEDGSDSAQAAQLVTGAAPMAIRGQFTFGGDTSYSAALQRMTIASGENAYMSAAIPHIPQVTGVNWQVTRFIRIDEPTTASPGTQLMAVDTNGRVATWRVNINDAQLTITGEDSDGVGVVLDTMVSDPANWFGTDAIIVLEVTDDGANVDWALSIIPIPLGSIYQITGTFVGNTGVPSYFRNSCTGPPQGISLGHLIITTNKVIGWLAPADTAYAFEPAAQRIFRLCSEHALPVAVNGVYGSDWDAVVLAGSQPMGPQRPVKLLDLLDECAEVDQGILSEQRGSLGLVYRSGTSLWNQEPRLTLSRARRQLIEPFGPTDDDFGYVNDVTTSRPDGSSAHIEDPRILTGERERYQQTTSVNVASDLQLPSQAGWRYHLGTWEELRYPEIATDIAKTADTVEDVLGLSIGDRFQVPDPPPGHPPDTIDQIVDGITEELERFQWRLTFNGRPARPWDVAVVDDDELGRLDTAGSELASAFTVGTNTTMSVATTLGPLWTTDGAEFPFDVEVAGARVTVTGISGATSPQTFTVTQAAVNGVEKVIPAGTDVHLWQGAVVSL